VIICWDLCAGGTEIATKRIPNLTPPPQLSTPISKSVHPAVRAVIELGSSSRRFRILGLSDNDKMLSFLLPGELAVNEAVETKPPMFNLENI
jgi:hypothetical protein